MDIKINIVYKKIKNIHLKVKDGQVFVSAPFFTSKDYILKFVNSNLDFINKQIEKQKLDNIEINQQINILDNKYQILNTTSNSIKYSQHFIFLNDKYDLKKQIKVLFKEKMYNYMYNLTVKYYKLMNLSCNMPTIKIKDVKTKWGSYNKVKHEIIYSSNLLFKDVSLYDYIVVHELAHILQFNHSKNFYEIIKKYCPNYKEIIKELKEV